MPARVRAVSASVFMYASERNSNFGQSASHKDYVDRQTSVKETLQSTLRGRARCAPIHAAAAENASSNTRAHSASGSGAVRHRER